jgi:CheY-like chemotaxis protein
MNAAHHDAEVPLASEENHLAVAARWRPASGMVVLLADDDDDDRMLTADAFREARLLNEMHFVSDGEELLDYLHRRGKFAPPAVAQRPGLILLDLNMPRKDGREALREIKSDPDLRNIPVVILTTSETQADINQIYGLGACSYISKPVTFDALVRAMKVIGEYWFQLVKLPGPTDAG